MSADPNNNQEESGEKRTIDQMFKDGIILSPKRTIGNYSADKRKEFIGIPKKLDFSDEQAKDLALSFDEIEEIEISKNVSAVVGFPNSKNNKNIRHS